MNYGAEWRQHRRAFHQVMNSDIVSDWQPVQLKATRNFLRSLLGSPDQLASHLQFSFAATVMRVVYGIELRERNDEYFKMIRRLSDIGEDITVPGRYPVDAIPILRFLPSWFPGGHFKRYAARARRDALSIRDQLFQSAKTAIERGSIKDCIITRLWKGEGDDAMEEVCRSLGATTYAAGADTVHASAQAFFLAMARHPEVQRKAQSELDTIIGPDRLPEFSDLKSLPYISAVMKELLRWHIITPIGLPHRTVADDEYNGYLIPGGTIVLGIYLHLLCRGISREPTVYPDPEDFIPERFLDSNGKLDARGKDPSDYAFGFGRRICPGQYFAEASLTIMIASVLSTFNIRPPTDEYGASIKVEHEVTMDRIVS
ncbi:cytochrome P450 [Dichomitus squalens]|uniref:Cytochrome P450 n=1 Tax=Dichomitus squalens TaxID=114155 RepID=A0A4Q9MRE6_9APHY|nr:cytochrome P450 [Dichomitus squalens]